MSKPTTSDPGSYSNITTSQKTLSTSYFTKQSPTAAVKPWPTPIPSEQSSLPTPSPKSNSSPIKESIKRKSDLVDAPKKAQKTIGTFFQTKTSTTKQVDADIQGSVYQLPAECPPKPQPLASLDRSQSFEKRLEVSNAFATMFVKPEVPLCDGHKQPAKLQKTKKKGANQGREFYMCAVPLGAGQCKFWKWRKT